MKFSAQAEWFHLRKGRFDGHQIPEHSYERHYSARVVIDASEHPLGWGVVCSSSPR